MPCAWYPLSCMTLHAVVPARMIFVLCVSLCQGSGPRAITNLPFPSNGGFGVNDTHRQTRTSKVSPSLMICIPCWCTYKFRVMHTRRRRAGEPSVGMLHYYEMCMGLHDNII